MKVQASGAFASALLMAKAPAPTVAIAAATAAVMRRLFDDIVDGLLCAAIGTITAYASEAASSVAH